MQPIKLNPSLGNNSAIAVSDVNSENEKAVSNPLVYWDRSRNHQDAKEVLAKTKNIESFYFQGPYNTIKSIFEKLSGAELIESNIPFQTSTKENKELLKASMPLFEKWKNIDVRWMHVIPQSQSQAGSDQNP